MKTIVRAVSTLVGGDFHRVVFSFELGGLLLDFFAAI